MKRTIFTFLLIIFASISISNAALANAIPPKLTDSEIIVSVQKALDSKLASNFDLGLRLKIVTSVTSYRPFDVFDRTKKSEKEVTAKVVVEPFINLLKLSDIMKQRKKERDFFGMIGKEREDVKDSQLEKKLDAQFGQFIIASLTFKQSSNGVWEVDQSSLSDRYVTRDNATVAAALDKRNSEIAAAKKEREKLVNTYAESVKEWIKSDDDPWVTEDCRVPCDHGHIPERSYALYRAREVLNDILTNHTTTGLK